MAADLKPGTSVSGVTIWPSTLAAVREVELLIAEVRAWSGRAPVDPVEAVAQARRAGFVVIEGGAGA